MILAIDEDYDEKEYIRNYDDLLKSLKENN